jgi:PAS domain-containing protein
MKVTSPPGAAGDAAESWLTAAENPAFFKLLSRRTKVSFVTQRPLELILARNLMSALSTPAFLVDEGGLLVFYNEAAGMLLGKRFEELGTVGPQEWGSLFGPFDESGEPIPYDDLPLVKAVRAGRPAHAELSVRSTDGTQHDVEVSAFPILTPHGSQGAIAVFWPSLANGAHGNGALPA